MLWALVLLSVMAGGFVRETRTEMVLARNAVEGAQARALAEAGIHRAVLALNREDFEERWRADGGYREFLQIAFPLILSTASWSIQHFVDRVFGGAAEPLVQHLVRDKRLSADDLRDIAGRLNGPEKDDDG